MPEQRTVIALHSINQLVIITDKERVYCAVRNECLNLSRNKLYSKYPIVITYIRGSFQKFWEQEKFWEQDIVWWAQPTRLCFVPKIEETSPWETLNKH
jgi:hypothetical protein